MRLAVNCSAQSRPGQGFEGGFMAVRRLPAAGHPAVESGVTAMQTQKSGREAKGKNLFTAKNFYLWIFPILFYPIVLAVCSLIVRLDGAWFSQLIKPSFLLPDFHLALMTFLVYACMTIALFFLVRARDGGKQVLETGFSALFQLLWCIFFFLVKSPLAALLVNILLLIHTAILMSFVRKKSKLSFYLLIPFYAFLIYVAAVGYVILMLY